MDNKARERPMEWSSLFDKVNKDADYVAQSPLEQGYQQV